MKRVEGASARSRTGRRAAVLALAVVFAAAFALPRAAGAETLRIGGTGGAMGGLRLVAEKFRALHGDADVVIAPYLGSSGGIKAMLAGDLGIAVSARPLTAEERRLGAVQVEYARTPFVVVASGKRSGTAFTVARLADVYAGRIATWPDGVPIRLVLRPESDTDIAALRAFSPEMDRAVGAALSRKGMIVALTDQENVEKLERVNGALGAATLAQILAERRTLAALPLNGRAPLENGVANPSYPHWKTFFLVVGANRSTLAAEFIDFVRSKKGREILVRAGHAVAAGGGGR